MAENKRAARGKIFRQACETAKAVFFVSIESFRLMQAGWKQGKETLKLGLSSYWIGDFSVQVFENAQGCLVAILSTGEIFYAFASA